MIHINLVFLVDKKNKLPTQHRMHIVYLYIHMFLELASKWNSNAQLVGS